MAKSLSAIWVTMIIVVLFATMLITFATQFIGLNNPTSEVLGDSSVNLTATRMTAHLNDLQGSAQAIQDAVQKDKGDPVMIFLILKSMLALPWQMVGLVFGGFNDVLVFVFSRLFGGSFLLLLGVIDAVVIGIIIFLSVKFIRTGESER